MSLLLITTSCSLFLHFPYTPQIFCSYSEYHLYPLLPELTKEPWPLSLINEKFSFCLLAFHYRSEFMGISISTWKVLITCLQYSSLPIFLSSIALQVSTPMVIHTIGLLITKNISSFIIKILSIPLFESLLLSFQLSPFRTWPKPFSDLTWINNLLILLYFHGFTFCSCLYLSLYPTSIT